MEQFLPRTAPLPVLHCQSSSQVSQELGIKSTDGDVEFCDSVLFTQLLDHMRARRPAGQSRNRFIRLCAESEQLLRGSPPCRCLPLFARSCTFAGTTWNCWKRGSCPQQRVPAGQDHRTHLREPGGPFNASRPLTKELSNPTRCHIDSNAMLRLKTAPPFAGLLLPRCVMLF